ncbi:MAG: hypothetical protein E6R03_05385 [Hyphomicrobiaceae bacterium]|nr:MAG: hypothetical protein E6R03_05385 [Hyphomicrobiaceae bacterium]
MKEHPAASIFPMMDEEAYELFKADIKENGQREPITVWQGQLLDGRNRLKACEELGIKPATFELDKSIDPISWVLSHNLHRRHLDTSQRGMVAAKLASLPVGSNQHSKEGTQKCAPSVEQAAELLNVSPRTVNNAKKVIDKGSAEVVKAVEQGALKVTTAAEFVEEEPDKREQTKLVKKGVEAVKAHITEPEHFPEQNKPPKMTKAEQAVFNATMLSEILKTLRHAKKLAKAVPEQPGMEIFLARQQSIEREILSACDAVQVTIPHSVCPRCKGKGCAQCGNHGWVNHVLARELENVK